MSLKVTVRPNPFGSAGAPYVIHSRSEAVLEEAEFLEILAAGRTTLSKPDLAAALALIGEELGRLLAEGKYVKTSFGSFYLCASGTLEHPTEAFHPGRGVGGQRLAIHYRPLRRFEARVLRNASLERDSSPSRSVPWIEDFAALPGGGMMGRAGGYLRLRGRGLSFDPEDSEQGLFFSNGSQTRAMVYVERSPRLIIAEIPPSLRPGEYRLCLRKRPPRSRLRTIWAEEELLIEEAPGGRPQA